MLLLLACALPGSPVPDAAVEARAPEPATLAPSAPSMEGASSCAAPFDSEIVGYDGSPACVAGSARWSHVPAADRGCATDADCTVVSADTCFHLVVSAKAASAYSAEHPCVHPAAGMCPPTAMVAVCETGCCVAR